MHSTDTRRFTSNTDEILRLLRNRSWKLTGIRFARRIQARNLRSAALVDGALVLELPRHTFTVNDFEMQLRGHHELLLHGSVLRQRKGMPAATPREGTIKFEDPFEVAQLKRRVLEARFDEERERAADIERRLQIEERRIELREAGYPPADIEQLLGAVRPLTAHEAVQALEAGGKWNAHRAYRDGSRFTSEASGRVKAREKNTLLLESGSIRLSDFDIVWVAPWRLALRRKCYQLQLRPRNIGGGYREVTVMATAFNLTDYEALKNFKRKTGP